MDRTNGTVEADGVHVALFDWAETTPSTALVETVAAATGSTAQDLDQLYEVVDPDALDSIVAGTDGAGGGDTRIALNYAGQAVSVASDGTVRVAPAD